MSIYYKPSDADRVYNFIGVQVNPEKYLHNDLPGDVYEAEVIKIKKIQAQDIPSVKTAIDLWKKWGENNLSIPVKLMFSEKLEHISQKDSKNCFITRFFLRIVGLMKGRGFNTEAEWGIQTARHIKSQQLNLLKTDIKAFLTNPEKINLPYFQMVLNDLSEKLFKELLEMAFFNQVEGANNLDPAKYLIIDRLDADKLDLFFKLILERSDWFEQVVDMDGAALTLSEEALETVYQRAGMFAYKFMEDQKSILAWYNKKFPGFRMHEKDYFGLLLQLSIRSQIMNGSFKPSFVEPYKKIIADLTPILSPEELSVLENQGIKFNKS